MDIREHTAEEHPDELLAGYVDGSAPPDERSAVESHLAACEQCRAEVELATLAKAALASLPELEAPGLAGAGLDAFREPAAAGADENAFGVERAPARRVRGPGRRIHWDRVALGAGLAAAAGLFVIFVVIGITRTGGKTAATGAANSSAKGLPPVVDRGATYSPASLQALTAQLRAPAEKRQTLTRAPEGAPFDRAAQATPVASQPSPAGLPADSAAVLSCLQNGTGLLSTAKPFYLESAIFQGTPAFIGAFVLPPSASGAASHLVVAAVSRSGCQPLYEVRQSL